MNRKWLGILLALLLLTQTAALAETEFTGSVAAGSTFAVTAAYGGTVEAVLAAEGDLLSDGGALVRLSAEKIYAPVDGTVAMVYAAEGDDASAATQRYGAAIVIEPQKKYTVYMTAEEEYRADETKRISVGETLYLRCKADGTHKGVGVVTEADGYTYSIECIGGEFSNGEVVYAGRVNGFGKSQRVGIGTVLAAEASEVAAEGVVIASGVSAGDRVEAGQLLMQTASGSLSGDAWNDGAVTARQAGILQQLLVREGDSVQQGQVIAVLANPAALCVETNVSEEDLPLLQSGDAVQICFEDGSTVGGEVTFVSYIADADGAFAVQIAPAQPLENVMLGQSAAIISARNE